MTVDVRPTTRSYLMTEAAPERLSLRGVAKTYGTVQVLQPTDLSVRNSEFLTVLGPSGSGKTTILRLIAGFVRPSAGRVMLGNTDITETPPHRRPFNTVFQDYALFPHMSVARNVAYGPMIRGVPRAEIKRMVRETLEMVAMGDMLDRRPSQLSGGQRQRVALARAIVNRPDVILLDEPLGALDAELRRSMQLFLKDLQARIRTTFLFVTHDQEEAITMSDRIVVMGHGRIAQVGPPLDLYRRPESLFVAGFFGDNNLLSGEGAADGTVRTRLGVLRTGQRVSGPVTAAIRPEQIRLRHAPDAVELGVRLEQVIFSGPTIRIEATGGTAQEKLLIKVVGSDAGLVPDPGSTLRVWIPPEAVHLIRT